jgi:hypothetical protein
MNWDSGIALFLFTAAISWLICLWAAWSAPPAEAKRPAKQAIRYSFTVRNTSAELLRQTWVRVCGPVCETATQRTIGLQASHPFELLTDELGNQLLDVPLTLLPYEIKVVSVQARLIVLDGTSRQQPCFRGDSPARGMIGFITDAGGILRRADSHHWMEFYADGAWHLADPQPRAGAPDICYVATRILGGHADELLDSGQPFMTGHPKVEMSMD